MSAHRKSSSTPPTAVSLLDGETHVAKLTAHAGRLLHLQRQLEAVLPRPLAKVVRVANYRLGKLVLHAVNGAVAVKLRQVLPGLAEKLRQTGAEVNEIEVKVQPARPKTVAPETHTTMEIGDRAKQGLTSLARSLPPGAPLRAALERLAAKK